jgi:hypothetical protein
MRCPITNKKKLKKRSEKVGMEVIEALTRGNTNHRIDFTAKGDTTKYKWSLYSDGTVEESQLFTLFHKKAE